MASAAHTSAVNKSSARLRAAQLLTSRVCFRPMCGCLRHRIQWSTHEMKTFNRASQSAALTPPKSFMAHLLSASPIFCIKEPLHGPPKWPLIATMNVNGAEGKAILDCLMHKLPWSRKYYQVRLVVPETGSPFVEYRQVSNLIGARKTKKSAKVIRFTDLLFADKKHDTSEKYAFSIYSIDKTITFLAQDEGVMNEWLTKIRELHSSLYPEFKRYDSIFEAKLLDKGLATTLQLHGHYRLAVCKESLDLIPLLTLQDQLQHQQQLHQINNNTNSNSKTTTQANNNASPASNSTTTTVTSNVTANPSTTNSTGVEQHTNHSNHHHPIHHHHDTTNTPNNFSNSSYLQNQHEHHHHPLAGKISQSQDHHHHLPQHLPIHQRFLKRHPLLASKTIELVLRSIRRCGHTQANFYIESGRQSPIGQGDLWMSLSNKATARQLHELLLATMKLASATEDQYPFKAPRSRSGSSSDNTQRSQPSLVTTTALVNHDNNNIEEDSGYLAMA